LTRLRDAPERGFGENLPGRFRIFEIDGTVLPVLVMEPTQPAAAVCSNLSRYVHYPLSEARKQCSGLRLLLLEAGAAGWGLLLSALRVDRAIFINNHLLSHSPTPGLGSAGLRPLIDRLVAEFPRHVVILRTVNPTLTPELAKELQAAGARLLPYRHVSVLDPTLPAFRQRRDVRRDRKLLQRTPYEVVAGGPGVSVDPDRLAELYRGVYLVKHCRFNAAFNRSFFEALLATPAIRWAFWRHPETRRIDAFSAWFAESRFLTSLLLGYDLSVPVEQGLYRMALMYKVFADAEIARLPINLGGGVSEFKQLRGARLVQESLAIWDQHLPPQSRLMWRLLEWEGSLFGRDRRAAASSENNAPPADETR
jgi:hypothetical protein